MLVLGLQDPEQETDPGLQVVEHCQTYSVPTDWLQQQTLETRDAVMLLQLLAAVESLLTRVAAGAHPEVLPGGWRRFSNRISPTSDDGVF